jgi:hypothetical protein
MRIRPFLFLAALACASAILPAAASPWAEVGDNQLRSDVEWLQASGLLSTITIQWPLPWAGIAAQLDAADLSAQPAAVRAAANRLMAGAHAHGIRLSAYADVTNKVSVVRGFDRMGRGDGQAQVSLQGASGAFSGRLSIGAITNEFGGKPNKLMLDGTYAAVDFWGARLYAGYLDHWWGPGEISALQLSNNARPMPQIGISRSTTQASSWPVLKWLGPWQFEFFIAKLDGPQKQSNVYYNATRLTISPLPGLELGVAKTEEICGQGHSCVPLRDYFRNIDFSTHENNVNGEGSFEAKYSRSLGGVPFELHMQMMNEDYSLAKHSGTSHLVGASVWVPTAADPVKLTAEYTDSIATLTMLGLDDHLYGFTYHDFQFPDGMHYRDRTLGFSLDSDSTLLSLQGSWSDAGGRFYEISLHHAAIGNAHAVGTNIVSPVPVKLNLGEARVSLPLNMGDRGFTLDLAGRMQDDQPRPHQGFAAAIEAALRIGL